MSTVRIEASLENSEATAIRAAEALRLCLAGDGDAGLAIYRMIARPRLLSRVPLGLHIHLLNEKGLNAAADELSALGVRHGGDIAFGPARPNAALGDIAAEYEALLACGLANPLMVNRYLVALTRLERTDEAAAIYDVTRRVHRVRLPGADKAAAAMLALEHDDAPASRLSVRNTREIRPLGQVDAFDSVLAASRVETEAYLARWAMSDHPLAHLVPGNFTMNAWGLISRGEGFNTRHTHPVGWATGVYYPVGIPAGASGGALEIGGWRDPAPAGWPRLHIRPEPGLLVIIPSYYVHWTEPLGMPGLRMSIAFDAIPD